VPGPDQRGPTWPDSTTGTMRVSSGKRARAGDKRDTAVRPN